ncbi:MAG TPA: hypothetical protein VN038_19385 [Dyadobacter sp.]|nr:hypothetical protein [Dyadobacter sp.]
MAAIPAPGAIAQQNQPVNPDTNAKAGITVVRDTTDPNKWRHYYKLANGRVLGEDSVYATMRSLIVKATVKSASTTV